MSTSVPCVCMHLLFFERKGKERVSYEIALVGKEKCDKNTISFNIKIFVAYCNILRKIILLKQKKKKRQVKIYGYIMTKKSSEKKNC